MAAQQSEGGMSSLETIERLAREIEARRAIIRLYQEQNIAGKDLADIQDAAAKMHVADAECIRLEEQLRQAKHAYATRAA